MHAAWPPSFTPCHSFRPSRRLRVLAGIACAGTAAAWLAVSDPATAATGLQNTVPGASTRWLKGNLHTHTINSDGDSTPEEVVRWYREHGYDFLVLTDHNFLTGVDGLNALQGAAGRFLVVKGEEVTELPVAGKVLDGWAIDQAARISRLVGLEHDASVRRWFDGGRLGLLALALDARQCRRRRRDQIWFFGSCVLNAFLMGRTRCR